jgi:hypothetical protein
MQELCSCNMGHVLCDSPINMPASTPQPPHRRIMLLLNRHQPPTGGCEATPPSHCCTALYQPLGGAPWYKSHKVHQGGAWFTKGGAGLVTWPRARAASMAGVPHARATARKAVYMAQLPKPLNHPATA